MNRHRFGAVAALAAAPLLALAAQAAPCALGSVSMNGGLYPTSLADAAVFDTVASQGEGRWDMTAGRVFMRQNGGLGGLLVVAYDDFDVTGVPPGTVVNVLARLAVDGSIWTPGCGASGCYGRYVVTLRHGSDSLVVFRYVHLYSGSETFHDEIQLLVPITAGTPERIEIRAFGRKDPGGSHGSEADCVLSFTGLDEGVGVTSCKGFAGMIVPALPSSWGRLKTLYR